MINPRYYVTSLQSAKYAGHSIFRTSNTFILTLMPLRTVEYFFKCCTYSLDFFLVKRYINCFVKEHVSKGILNVSYWWIAVPESAEIIYRVFFYLIWFLTEILAASTVEVLSAAISLGRVVSQFRRRGRQCSPGPRPVRMSLRDPPAPLHNTRAIIVLRLILWSITTFCTFLL